MTRLDPSLMLTRLVVVKDGQRAYDEFFHAGVNIIRGVQGQGNSVGKSTIADLIFFALGGDLTSWKDEAKLCDATFAEVLLNGMPVTLKREISEQIRRPMAIFIGGFDQAHRSAADGWQVFPYQRFQNRQSFTQVLFRLMDMPEVPAEAESNITMHQLLRLMYVDQMTPVDRIFRFEAKDSALRRQAVGDLLCGVFDDRIYPAQLELREKTRELEVATQQFGALNRVLTNADEAFNLEFVEARKRSVSLELEDVRAEIEQLREKRFEGEDGTADSGVIDVLQRDLLKVNADISERRSEVRALTYEVEDARLLIEETERTLARLKEGELALGAIGPISFSFCPSCFADLEPVAETKCKLCHKDLDADAEQARTARMRNELSMQLRESKRLQDERIALLAKNNGQVTKLEAIRQVLGNELVSITRSYTTEVDAQIDRLNSRAGYLERELVDVAREEALAIQLADLSKKKQDLNAAVIELSENIEAWKKQKDRKQEKAYDLIAKTTAQILSQDLPTEREFSKDASVYFDFSEDRVVVNGKTGFSASSLTILRNAFHLALQLASCAKAEFRYPRFLLMDNIEDKGMTEARSQNFQRLIVKLSEAMQVDHQIIFTTSMIAPDLDVEKYVIGEKYDFNNKSLKIGRRSSKEMDYDL